MNILLIRFDENGAITDTQYDFQIYQGSYRDVLINIEVPHSLLIDPVTDEDGTNTTGNNVRAGAKITTATGKILQTKFYEFQRVKDFARDGTTYRLYQRRMPKEFTLWETISSTSTDIEAYKGQLNMIINIVNWTMNDSSAKVEENKASDIVALDVYASNYLTDEEDVDSPSDFATLQSQVQELSADYAEVKADLYTEDYDENGLDGLGDFLKSKLKAGNKIILSSDEKQVEIAVDTLNASDIVLDTVDDLDANNLQTALEEISRRFDSKSVDTLSGEDDYLVDNSDPNNPVVMHDTSKVDITTFDDALNELSTQISTNADGISDLNTNLTSYSLIADTGSKIDLDINMTNYVMTLALKNATGETISSDTIDFPLESMVVGASYKSGTLTLTLQNGTTLDIDISSIIDGLVNSSELENYVQVTDYATNSVFGIVRADQINGIQASNGVLSIMGATDTQIENKASNGRPLQAKHIDKIVQLGITTNTNTLTEDEQAKAQEWLGINGVTDIINSYKYIILDDEEEL